MKQLAPSMIAAVSLFAVCSLQSAFAQQFASGNDSPAARMRPIGSASAVDQYRQPVPQFQSGTLRETSYSETANQEIRQLGQAWNWPSSVSSSRSNSSNPVRQTAMQFALPGSESAGPTTRPGPSRTGPPPATFTPPPSQAPFSQNPLSQPPAFQSPASQLAPPPQSVAPPQSTPPPPSLPFSGSNTALPIQPRSDYAPMVAPSLSSSFANINNCANISAPSGYSAAMAGQCGSGYGLAPVGFQAPPAQIPAPAILPGAPNLGAPVTGVAPVTNPAPIGSLLTFGQEQNVVQVGQGIIGQPKAYVPGQTIRNWLRYFTP